jgi:hypothetical protein
MKRQIILHPILFALWAFVFMYVHNMEQMFFRDVVVTLVMGVGATLVVWGLLYLLLRNWRKAAIITSFIVVTFFSYGRISTPIDAWGSAPKLLLWLGLIVGFILIVARSRRHFDRATLLLNIMALVLLGTVVGLWGNYRLSLAPGPVAQVDRYLAAWQAEAERLDTSTCSAARSMPRPNIYYIILDGFGRADVLQDLYQIDDPDWIDGLQQLGFYVADHSTSNYGQTALSLASSLNLTYLDGMASQIDYTSTNRLPLKVMLEENRVVQFLRCAGYRIVYFPTGYVFVDLTTGVDQIMAPPGSLTAYQNELLRTTPLFAISAALFRKTEHDYYRDRIRYIFEPKDAARRTARCS